MTRSIEARPLTDEAGLLDGARRRDSRALAAIHDRFYPDLYRYLLYRTSDEHVAEDLSSEVFMRLLDALQAGRAPDSLRGWLFGVANHLAADHFRRHARHPQVELSDELPSSDSDPESLAGHGVNAAAVRAALAELTDDQQQVLALRFNEGRSIAEAAALMDKSIPAVKQLQFRAVAALRRKLEGSV